MESAIDGDNVAVLIDADSVSFRNIAGLMAKVVNYGTASVKRIYGDWTCPQMRGWRGCLLAHSIVPIQQFAYTTGKNATDGAMIIDAMGLLYTGRFFSFCLVSSDSDFTRLAARIREHAPVSYHGVRCIYKIIPRLSPSRTGNLTRTLQQPCELSYSQRLGTVKYGKVCLAAMAAQSCSETSLQVACRGFEGTETTMHTQKDQKRSTP